MLALVLSAATAEPSVGVVRSLLLTERHSSDVVVRDGDRIVTSVE